MLDHVRSISTRPSYLKETEGGLWIWICHPRLGPCYIAMNHAPASAIALGIRLHGQSASLHSLYLGWSQCPMLVAIHLT